MKTSSFYKQLQQSPRRERTKTEYTMEKYHIEMPKTPAISATMCTPRKKGLEIRYYRIKETSKINVRKLTEHFDCNPRLNFRNLDKQLLRTDSPRAVGQSAKVGKKKEAKEPTEEKGKLKSMANHKYEEYEHKEGISLLKAKLKQS
jgi:hypothetical protein